MIYTVFVDDNYQTDSYQPMDESQRHTLGEFADCESAVAACRKVVDDFLDARKTLTAEEQFSAYRYFGKNPWISSADPQFVFSAWRYAEQRCAEIARQHPPVYTVLVDDNYDPMDGFDRYKLGDFPDCASAIAACKRIVDESLSNLKTGNKKELLNEYRKYGKTPFILSSDKSCTFSAGQYAGHRCHELAAEQEGQP